MFQIVTNKSVTSSLFTAFVGSTQSSNGEANMRPRLCLRAMNGVFPPLKVYPVENCHRINKHDRSTADMQ